MSNFIGPCMPPNLDDTDREINYPNRSNISDSQDSSSDSESDSEKTKDSNKMIGPILPKNFKLDVSNSDSSSSDEEIFGPVPLPQGTAQLENSSALEFERRSLVMKRKMEEDANDDTPKKREDWMTILPDNKIKSGLGLVERKFKSKALDSGDRSVWTKVPGKKDDIKNDNLKSKHEHVFSAERDSKLQQEIDEHNEEKRSETLLDIHRGKGAKSKKSSKDKKESSHKKSKKEKKEKKKKKKKHKDEDEKNERRPFDRDTDMKVNKFDDAMKKKYIERAQGISKSFGHGGQKFL